MAWLRAVSEQLSQRRTVALDIVRIYLGLALLVRGILFLQQGDLISNWALKGGADLQFLPTAGLHYTILAHLGGGLLLTLGLLTRLSALAQVPVLIGAVFLVHFRDGLLGPGQSLELAALVLFTLVVLSVFGSGPWSMDALLNRNTVRATSPPSLTIHSNDAPPKVRTISHL